MFYRAKLNLLKIFWRCSPELVNFKTLKVDHKVEAVDVFSKLLEKYINLDFNEK